MLLVGVVVVDIFRERDCRECGFPAAAAAAADDDDDDDDDETTSTESSLVVISDHLYPSTFAGMRYLDWVCHEARRGSLTS